MKLGRSLCVATFLLGASAAGCLGSGPVVRILDGRAVTGRFIPVAAYASFLAGALAEEKGDLDQAIVAYEAAASSDSHAPEIWTRLGLTRCRRDPKDPRARSALDEAMRQGAHFEPALVLRERCGHETGTTTVQAETPDGDGLSALAASADPADEADSEARRRAIEALTLTHGDRVAAWEALAAWGLAHGDSRLAVRGLIGLAQRSPGRRLALGKTAMALAGQGQLTAARELASALLDAPGDRSAGGEAGAPAALPRVARLAIDNALLAHDAPRALERSTRAHVGVEIAGGRAWLLGEPELARALVATTVKSDPSNLDALLIKEGASGRAATRLLADRSTKEAGLPAAPLAPEVALPFARDVLVTQDAAAARRVLAFGGGSHVPAGDALLTPVAVDLAIAGVIEEGALPSDARIELAARRFRAPLEADVLAADTDARHRLLGLALLRPNAVDTGALARQLASAVAEDPLVAASLAKIVTARHEALEAPARALLEQVAPGDPIAAGALLDLARTSGPPAALATARTRLAALARTPEERARATE